MILLLLAFALYTLQQQPNDPEQESTVITSPVVDSSIPVLQDDGFGACPAFQHSHPDGHCYRDDNDLIIPDPPDPKEIWL